MDESIYDNTTASTDNTSSSSTPAEDTETVEDSTSDNTDASVGSTSSSSTPAEDTESTEVSSTNSTTTEVIPTNSTTTEIIPVNGTVIPGTNSTEIIPVNGTVIPGTNSTIPVIVPNATESWSFDTQVNGSKFIGDVYIEKSDSSLILEGDGYLSNDGNSTSDLSNLSVTAWVNPDYSGGSAEFTVISKEKAFALTINNNIEPIQIATFAVFDGIKWHSVQTTEEIGNDWSHLAATFNGTTLSIYTNGTISNVNESIETIELTIEGQLEPKSIETIESTSDVIVGATLDNNRSLDDITKQFYGEIKEVNIFNIYLSAQQVTEIYLQTLPMIQSLYNNTVTEIIEEQEETIIIDVLAPQQITNATSIDTTNATDTSLTFNETQTYVPIETELLNEELNKLTISTWINPSYDSGSPKFTVVSKENSFILGINNIYSPKKVPTFTIFDVISWTKISGTTQVYDWLNLVATINGTEISLYLNGNLEATTILPESFVILDGEVTTIDSSIAENNADLVIGAYLDTFRDNISLSNHFSGVIDDVLVYKEALSEDEISQIYAGYVTPSENSEIPFEDDLLSFTDTITIFLNDEPINDTIHVVEIDVETQTPSTAQSLAFGDYVTYKVNGNAGESSVEVMTFSDVVVATIIPVNYGDDSDVLYESLLFSDVLTTTIHLNSTINNDSDVLYESLLFSDVLTTTIHSNSTINDDYVVLSESLLINDVIFVSINKTGLIHISESLSLDVSLSLGNNTTLSNGITSDIQLQHDTIEINKPVTWTHDVIFSNNTESVAVEIPADAEIIMVKTFNDTSETIIFDSEDSVSNISNYTGLYDDQDISDKDLKKHFRLIDSIKTIEANINKTNDKIAYYADLDTAKAHKKLDKLGERLEKLEGKLENKLTKLSDNVPLASLQQVEEMIQVEKPLKVLFLNNTDANIELTFTTPAAYTVEQNNSTNDKFNKKITVAHDSALHYTNVTAFSDIPEELVIGGTDFKLFWNIKSDIPVNGTIIQDTNSTATEVIPTNSTSNIQVNSTGILDSTFVRVDVTNDPRFAVEFVDTDKNSIVDRMQWIVPQLSEQEFDIEADLEIINVQSYPAVGGNWKVKFTTNGTADLIISAINGTTFGTESPDDLLFLELNNGTHTLNPIVNGNTITIYNYSSTEIGFEESEVLTPFKHHLMFQFGNKTGYAHNSVFVPNGPKAILLYDAPVVTGSPDTEDDMALTNAVIPGWDQAAERQDSIYTHDHTGGIGGCNDGADTCTEVQVSEAGTYRVNYGLSIDGGFSAARYQAVSYVQNDTDGTGGYNEDEGWSGPL